MRLVNGLIAAAALLMIAGCSGEQPPALTDSQKACISQRFSSYDATKLDQCVNVCRTCMQGTPTSCTASCKLRGAS